MTGIIENGTIVPVTAPAIVVLGATGDIGRGVVQAAVESGRAVVAVADDVDGLRRMVERHPFALLTTVFAALHNDAAAAHLAVQLREAGQPLSGVVAAIAGKRVCGSLINQSVDVLRQALDDDLMPHLFAARHLLPLLPSNGSHGYVLIGGPGGDYPWAGYGHCSIAASALRMLARVLHDEAGRAGLRVQLLSLDAPVGSDDGTACTGMGWPNALAVGQQAISMLAASGQPAAPIVRFPTTNPRPTASAPRRAMAIPARDLRDARALLSTLSSAPPANPGILHDETL